MAEEKLAEWQILTNFALREKGNSDKEALMKPEKTSMETILSHKYFPRILSFLLIAVVTYMGVSNITLNHPFILTPDAFHVIITLLFILLIDLTARLARTNRTGLGILCTWIFISLFNPGMDQCMVGDEEGLIELGSQCIVPFFIMQYRRIRTKDFSYGYFLMFLMGIFCSYTHNGIAIPLCACFLWITWRHRERFFKMACWPMVIGFVIGTSLSIFTSTDRDNTLPEQFLHMSRTTWEGLTTLWDTKVFVLTVVVTAYLLRSQQGRQLIRHTVRRHYAVCTCMAFSLLSLPLAPLGINNAVTGVCFFSMYWLLFITKYMVERNIGWKM